MKRKICYALIFTLFIAIFNVYLPHYAQAQDVETSYKTITELGNPIIAGPGDSYYDDGVFYYTNSGNTIGYNIDHSNVIFDFDLIFNTLAWPSWFSLTLKADGVDRTQSPNLTQKGYSFVFFPAGQVQVWKEGFEGLTANISPILTETKYNIKIGAVNTQDGVLLTLFIDNKQVINYLDINNPYTQGNYFNICADGTVSANLISTKKIIFPDYYTYTLSTLGSYPYRAGAPLASVDKNNNIQIFNSTNTVGFDQRLQNFSLEMKFNFSVFEWPANFYISTRVGGFDRAMSSNLTQKGYSFRLGAGGSMEIYKDVVSLGAVNIEAFEANREYVIEVGVVDIDENSTNLFLIIDKKVVLSVTDSNNPIQTFGYLNLNGDGNVACSISSVCTKITPLMTKVNNQQDKLILTTYLLNSFSSKEMNYNDFSNVNLKAILLNDNSVFNINEKYYVTIDGQRQNAIDVKYFDNCLQIVIYKNVKNNIDGSEESINYNELAIKKSSANGGLTAPSGNVLKQTYYYNF